MIQRGYGESVYGHHPGTGALMTDYDVTNLHVHDFWHFAYTLLLNAIGV